MVVVILIVIVVILVFALMSKSDQSYKDSTPIHKEVVAKRFIKQVFENTISNVYKNNKLKGTELEGYVLLEAFNKVHDHLINDIPSLANRFYLPQESIRFLIEEVSKEIYNGVFEN